MPNTPRVEVTDLEKGPGYKAGVGRGRWSRAELGRVSRKPWEKCPMECWRLERFLEGFCLAPFLSGSEIHIQEQTRGFTRGCPSVFAHGIMPAYGVTRKVDIHVSMNVPPCMCMMIS